MIQSNGDYFAGQYKPDDVEVGHTPRRYNLRTVLNRIVCSGWAITNGTQIKSIKHTEGNNV